MGRRRIPRQQFRAFLESNLDGLYRTALRLCRDRAQAEDLVQESVLKALEAWRNAPMAEVRRAWLMKVLVNLYIDQFNKDRRSPEKLALHDALSLEAQTESRPVEKDVVRTEFTEALYAALEGLPLNQRLAVSFVYIEGYSVDETAIILGLPCGTVSSRLFRGRRALAKMLDRFRTGSLPPQLKRRGKYIDLREHRRRQEKPSRGYHHGMPRD